MFPQRLLNTETQSMIEKNSKAEGNHTVAANKVFHTTGIILCNDNIEPYAEIGASLNKSHFSLLLWGGCFCCFVIRVWLYSKYCEQMIIDFHQLSHYCNITYYLLPTN